MKFCYLSSLVIFLFLSFIWRYRGSSERCAYTAVCLSAHACPWMSSVRVYTRVNGTHTQMIYIQIYACIYIYIRTRGSSVYVGGYRCTGVCRASSNRWWTARRRIFLFLKIPLFLLFTFVFKVDSFQFTSNALRIYGRRRLSETSSFLTLEVSPLWISFFGWRTDRRGASNALGEICF